MKAGKLKDFKILRDMWDSILAKSGDESDEMWNNFGNPVQPDGRNK